MKESAKINNPEFSVDKIVARMKEAAARKAPTEDFASSEVVTSAEFQPARKEDGFLTGIEIHPLTLQPPFHPHSDGRYHVNDLLKFHDRSFVQHAYRAILKRGPDAIGYKSFLESLRTARLNKIDVLARLRYSPEGRGKKVEIEGLRLPAFVRKAYRVPVIGYLLNLAVAFTRLPLLIRSQQQFEAHVLAQQEMIAEHHNHLGRRLRTLNAEASRALQQQAETIQQLEQLLQAEKQKQDEALAHLREQGEALATSLRGEFTSLLHQEAVRRGTELEGLREQVGQRIAEAMSQAQAVLKIFEAQARKWRDEISAAEVELRETDARQRDETGALAAELRQANSLQRERLDREIGRVFQKQQEVSTELTLQRQRLTTLLEEMRSRPPDRFDETQLRVMAAEQDHELDGFFASFDEHFRGPREEIKQRLRVYLPLIHERSIGSEDLPILDVGSGRGEWLELLSDEKLVASGVDSNRVLVAECNARGLKVTEEDLLDHVRGLANASLGAVTGFHIIEHLPIDTLLEFLDETVRVLKPGGAVIFETPNPQNVLVGSCNFYFDPTHRNPLPSQVVKFFLEWRGFVRVDVLNLNPSDDVPVADDSDLARRFNQYFYGPMDYAVVGYRP